MMLPLSPDCKQMITYKVSYFPEPFPPPGSFSSVFARYHLQGRFLMDTGADALTVSSYSLPLNEIAEFWNRSGASGPPHCSAHLSFVTNMCGSAQVCCKIKASLALLYAIPLMRLNVPLPGKSCRVMQLADDAPCFNEHTSFISPGFIRRKSGARREMSPFWCAWYEGAKLSSGRRDAVFLLLSMQ